MSGFRINFRSAVIFFGFKFLMVVIISGKSCGWLVNIVAQGYKFLVIGRYKSNVKILWLLLYCFVVPFGLLSIG